MSFVETGRSRPSREVLVRLSEALGLPYRDRNLLLESAGYARMHRESKLTDLESGRLHEILQFVLDRYEPYGAVVVDADWSLLMANNGYEILMQRLMGPRRDVRSDARPNILVELFRPGGVRERLRNWPEVAHHMLERLRRQVADNPLRGLPSGPPSCWSAIRSEDGSPGCTRLFTRTRWLASPSWRLLTRISGSAFRP